MEKNKKAYDIQTIMNFIDEFTSEQKKVSWDKLKDKKVRDRFFGDLEGMLHHLCVNCLSYDEKKAMQWIGGVIVHRAAIEWICAQEKIDEKSFKLACSKLNGLFISVLKSITIQHVMTEAMVYQQGQEKVKDLSEQERAAHMQYSFPRMILAIKIMMLTETSNKKLVEPKEDSAAKKTDAGDDVTCDGVTSDGVTSDCVSCGDVASDCGTSASLTAATKEADAAPQTDESEVVVVAESKEDVASV